MPELSTITVGGLALSKLLDKFAEKQLLALFGKGVRKPDELEAWTPVSRDLDGVHPFLDPQEPIPADRLSRAAKRLGVTEASLLENLDQLREKLGADLYPGTPG